MAREDAYRLVQKHAMRAWKDDLNFRELVMNDSEITSRVPAKQIEQAFSIERQLRNVDKIFKRVFGKIKSYRGFSRNNRIKQFSRE